MNNDLSLEEMRCVARDIASCAVRNQSTGCLEFSKDIKPAGYGHIWTGSRSVRANRAAWILFHGPIPPGLLVCHVCDNRRCIEPSHLFLGTNDENMADMVAKGRAPMGSRNGLAKLTEADVIAIYTMPGNTKAIAERFGVSNTNVRDIRSGYIWGHVTSKLNYKPPRYAPIKAAAKESDT